MWWECLHGSSPCPKSCTWCLSLCTLAMSCVCSLNNLYRVHCVSTLGVSKLFKTSPVPVFVCTQRSTVLSLIFKPAVRPSVHVFVRSDMYVAQLTRLSLFWWQPDGIWSVESDQIPEGSPWLDVTGAASCPCASLLTVCFPFGQMATFVNMASPLRPTLWRSLTCRSAVRARPWAWAARSSSTPLCSASSLRSSGTETVMTPLFTHFCPKQLGKYRLKNIE